MRQAVHLAAFETMDAVGRDHESRAHLEQAVSAMFEAADAFRLTSGKRSSIVFRSIAEHAERRPPCREARAPIADVMRRVGFAVGLLVFTGVAAHLGRDGCVDSSGGPISFLDALCNPSVT